MLAQHAEDFGTAAADIDLRIVALAAPGSALCLIEPGSDVEAQRLQAFGPDVDPYRLLQRKGERGDVVFERPRLDPQLAVVEHDAFGQGLVLRRLAAECVARAEQGPAGEPIGSELTDIDHEIGRGLAEQIPVVGRKLRCDTVDQARWPDHTQLARPTEMDAQQPVESAEMIEMPMADEDLAHSQQLARRQRRKVAAVEQHGAAAEAEIDI